MLNASFNPQHIPVSRYYTVSPHFYVEMGMEKSNNFLKVIMELGVKLGAFPAVCESNLHPWSSGTSSLLAHGELAAEIPQPGLCTKAFTWAYLTFPNTKWILTSFYIKWLLLQFKKNKDNLISAFNYNVPAIYM